jgi:hypothetical protein
MADMQTRFAMRHLDQQPEVMASQPGANELMAA